VRAVAATDQVWVSGLLHFPNTKFMWWFLVVVEGIVKHTTPADVRKLFSLKF
jgi:hypothetical protein